MVLDGRNSPIVICVNETFLFDPRPNSSGETAKPCGPEAEWAARIRLRSFEVCSTVHDILVYKNEYITKISVSRKFLPRKLCRCWNEASLYFSTATALQIRRIGILQTMGPTLRCKMMGHVWTRVGARCAKPKETDNCRTWLWTLRKLQNRVETFGTVEELSTWHDEWAMTGEGRSVNTTPQMSRFRGAKVW